MTTYKFSSLLITLIGLIPLTSAHADLTLSGRSSLSALGHSTSGQEVLQIKGNKLRRDVMDRGRAYSYLFDLTEHRIVVIDHGFRLAEIHATDDMKPPQAKAGNADFKMDMDKTGRQHDLQDWDCREYKLDVTMPAELGADKVTFKLNGTVWMAKGAKEQKDMAAFRKAASSPEFLVGLPAVAKITQDQAQALGETIRRLSTMGNLCALDVQTLYEGQGRMAELARKVPTRMKVTYDGYSGESIKDEAFEIPAGYRSVNK